VIRVKVPSGVKLMPHRHPLGLEYLDPEDDPRNA
jgi:hypothetical protein